MLIYRMFNEFQTDQQIMYCTAHLPFPSHLILILHWAVRKFTVQLTYNIHDVKFVMVILE